MSAGTGESRPGAVRGLRGTLHELARRAGEHHLLIYGSAIAFRALVSLIPLVLLGLGLLGALRLRSVWHDSLAPPIRARVTAPVYEGIDFSVEKILNSGTIGLVAFASLLVLWNLAVGVRQIMQALNTIHEVEETRPFWKRAGLSVALALAVAVGVLGSMLVVTAAPRLPGGLDALVGLGRWLVALGLLGLAVGLLVHYAPAERPEVGWASVGSVLVIGSWIIASLGFRFWVTSVADFRSAIGSLTVLLVLSAYVFTSAAILLVGVEVDEMLRAASDGKRRGAVQLLREMLSGS